MANKFSMNRRNFLGTAGTVTALSTLPNIMPASVLGANDRILMGIIGSGGRGRGVMRDFMGFDAKFIAVCDVFEPNLQAGLEMAGAGAKGYKDFRKLVEVKEIDAVLIGSCEHQHAPHLIATVEAGKDSYCEKPMSHSIEEGVKMVKAVRNTDRIVQVGMQRRSSPAVHEAKNTVIDQGWLGNIYMVKAIWNWNYSSKLNNSPLGGELDWEAFCYPARVSEFEPMKYRYWRYFWDFSGGNCTDQGTHLMDVIQWFMSSAKKRDQVTPLSAECFGGVYKMEGAETPDIFTALFDYGDFMATWTLNYTNRYHDGWEIIFQGDQGTLVLDDRGSRFYKDPNPGNKPDWEFEGPLPTVPHVENFLECMKSRKEPNAPVEVGHTAVSGPHLANVAWHHRKRAYMNREATEVRLEA
jgi:predicted dehydrogenase